MIINKFTGDNEVHLCDIKSGVAFLGNQDFKLGIVFLKTDIKEKDNKGNWMNVCINLENGESYHFGEDMDVHPVHAELNVSPLGVGDCL